jgi:mRNA interferase MazF
MVILTWDSGIQFLGEITIASGTTITREIPTEVFIYKEDGLPRNCTINCDHTQTVSKGKIGSLITTLPSG